MILKQFFSHMDPLNKSKTLKIKFFIHSFSAAWILLWFHLVFNIYQSNKNYYHFAARASQDNIREYHTTPINRLYDFYKILKYCEKEVPRNEEIQIILPTTDLATYYYLRDKARYFLYPRNYGDNSIAKKYILVYLKDDYTIPPGYQILKSFGVNKYLLKEDKNL